MGVATTAHLLSPLPIPPLAKAIYLPVTMLLFEGSKSTWDDNLDSWTKSYNFRDNELKCHLHQTVKNVKMSAPLFELSVVLFSSSFLSFKRGHSSTKFGQEVQKIKKFLAENVNNPNFLPNGEENWFTRPFAALEEGRE